MTAEKKKEIKRATIPIALISFIIVSSSIAKFQILDVIYLSFVMYFYIRFLIEVKDRQD